MNYERKVLALRQMPIVAQALGKLASQLPNTLFYHTPEHTDDVLNDAIMFATEDGLSERDLELLAIAAAYHDLGFIEFQKENETRGAEMARDAMLESGDYSRDEVEKVYQMICDTQVKYTSAGPKQIPNTELSKYLLDADVSNLGREDFFKKAELVRKEVGMEDKDAFYKGLLIFVGAQEWYSDAAKKLRYVQRESNLKELKRMIG